MDLFLGPIPILPYYSENIGPIVLNLISIDRAYRDKTPVFVNSCQVHATKTTGPRNKNRSNV